jgi:hypothetical protein
MASFTKNASTCTLTNNIQQNPVPVTLSDTERLKSTLAQYHPLLVEGLGNSDDRDVAPIANRLIQNLQKQFKEQNITKPILLISQGDPINSKNKGVASITRQVTSQLGIQKGLVCLDERHARNADRENVIYETRYSTLVNIVKEYESTLPSKIEDEVDNMIKEKNKLRKKDGKKVLRRWCKKFAMLQEMTKVAMKIISGNVTVAHTLAVTEIPLDSITSFYEVGLKLGSIHSDNMIYFDEEE